MDSLNVLLEEYKNLSSSMEELSHIPFTVVPLVAAIVAAIGILRTARPRSGNLSLREGLGTTTSPEPNLAGVAVVYAISFAVAWIAFLHSMSLGLTLRLTRIELLINQATSAQPNEQMCYYSLACGSFAEMAPGYRAAVLSVIILGITVMGLAIAGGLDALQWHFRLPSWSAKVVLIMPFLVSIGLLLNMARNEYATGEKKRALFEEFQVQAGPDYQGATFRKLSEGIQP